MDEIYSHSRLASFERCKRQFMYRYRLALPAEAESIEAFLGKRVHEVLERLYRFTGRGLVPTLPQVHRRYQQLFDEQYARDRASIRIVRLEHDVRFYREIGEHCLSNYYADHYPFDRDHTVGLEERIMFDVGHLDSGPVRLQGFVDRIARAKDGTLEIHDYKTGARIPSQTAIDSDRQLALYQIGIAPRVPTGAEVRLVWHYVRQGVMRESRRTSAQLDALRSDTLARVEKIREERDFPASPGPLCRWCEYREGCSASPLRRTDQPTYERRPTVEAAALAIATRRRAPRRSRVHPGQLLLPLEARAPAALSL